MTTLTEGQHTGEFIVSEANGSLSREAIILAAGQAYQAGLVLGVAKTKTATGAAAAGNTGNGAIGSVTAGGSAKEGIYLAICIEPASNGGIFEVEDPDGLIVGSAAVGVAFAGPVGFTIADGATDFVAGDRFAVTVVSTGKKYKEYDPDNTDGSQTACAILYASVDATDEDKDGVGLVRHAEVNAAEIVWFEGATDNQKATAVKQLEAHGIITR